MELPSFSQELVQRLNAQGIPYRLARDSICFRSADSEAFLDQYFLSSGIPNHLTHDGIRYADPSVNHAYMRRLEEAHIPYTNDRGTIWTLKADKAKVDRIHSNLAWDGLSEDARSKLLKRIERDDSQ